MKRGAYWPYAIAAFLAIVVLGYATVVYVAASDPSFSVEKDYYAKGLAWDKTMAQEQENARLGWTMTVDVGPAPGGQAEVVARLADRTGVAVDGAVIDVEAFPNVRASDILEASFAARQDHAYVAQLPIRRAGLWEFRFRVVRGGETFTETVTKEIGIAR